MEHIDLRKLNNDELYAIRKQVVRLKEQGRKGSEIEEITGLYQTRISQIWLSYQKEGYAGIRPQKSGRKPKTQMLLTDEEQGQIREIITPALNSSNLASRIFAVRWYGKTVGNLAVFKVFVCRMAAKRPGIGCYYLVPG